MTRLILTSVLTALLLVPAAAVAEAPVDVQGPITDQVGALTDAERVEVEAALDEFYEETGRQLFVVYVDSFDGDTGAEWAEATSRESGLGTADILLAVATKARSYGYDADADTFSDDDLQRVDREYILPALRDDDWAGAATGAVEGLTEVGSGSDVPWGWIALGSAAAVGAGAVAVHRTRRRFDHTHRVVDEHGNPVDPAAILSNDELEAAAAKALVAIDDALRTSEQELGFAEAQFGPEATEPFRTTLEQGRATVREAFALRQTLDDAEPETDEEWRAAASRIIALCEEVDTALDDHVDDFDAMRDLQTRAPEALTEVEARIEAVRADAPGARETWQRLTSAHGGPTIAALTGNLERADSLLTTAAAQASLGRAAVDGGDTAKAAVHLRAAEEATGQAATLLGAVATAETALNRERGEADTLLGEVTSAVAAVSAFVETHRGAVGTTARTRLSEAARLLEAGSTALQADPAGARTSLERAASLADEARAAAEADVAQWRAEQRTDSRPGGGFDSMVLGGILVDALRGSRTSSYGGSSRSRRTTRSTRSRSTRSTRTSGSFGGSRTRGRRSGGGRF